MSKRQPPKVKADVASAQLGRLTIFPQTSPTQRYWGGSQHIQALVVSYSNRKKRGKYIEGSPFFCIKRRDDLIPTARPFITYGAVNPYIGRECFYSQLVPSNSSLRSTAGPIRTPTTFSTPNPNSIFSGLITDGATGWARARPGNPLTDNAVTAGELLREGLPSVPGLQLLQSARARAGMLRAVGKEYLNIQFGWRPLVNDVRKLLSFRDKLQRELEFIIRNNGKRVRRRRIVRSTISSATTSTNYTGLGAFWPNPAQAGSLHASASSKLITQTITSEYVWFMGAFRFYTKPLIMAEPGWIDGVRRRLAGESLTPEVLWNLTPWSWLADWFTNAGDVMRNLSANAVDNLTADYAFAMSTVVVWAETTAIGTTPAHTQSGLRSDAWSESAIFRTQTVQKARYPASPYGFGFTWDGLSPYRASILAALGVSRARF